MRAPRRRTSSTRWRPRRRCCTSSARVASAALRLLDHFDLLPYFPAATRELVDPFRLRVTVQHEGKPVALNAIPDRLVSLVLPDNRRHNFCIEIDRATMSVAARRLSGKSSFGRKIRAYYAAWQQDRHRDQWGLPGLPRSHGHAVREPHQGDAHGPAQDHRQPRRGDVPLHHARSASPTMAPSRRSGFPLIGDGQRLLQEAV